MSARNLHAPQTANHKQSAGVGTYALLALLFVLCAASVGLHLTTPVPSKQRGLIPELETGADITKALKGKSAEERELLRQREFGFLRHEPLDLASLTNLAVLADIEGDRQQAETYVLEAAKRSLRDTVTQLGSAQINLASGNFEQGFYHIDGLLRARPTRLKDIQLSIVKLITVPEALPHLSKLLSVSPKWRNEFTAELVKTDTGGSLAYRLFSDMRKQGFDVRQDEMRSYLAAEFGRSKHDRAYFLWLDFLGPEQLTSVAEVFDGNFNFDQRNMYFDWNFEKFPNADIRITPKPGNAIDRALRLDFYASKGRFSNVYQYLRLAPGRYNFATDVLANNFKSEGGLVWQVSCIAGQQTGLSAGKSKAIVGSGPWNKNRFEINVPEVDCATQILRLESASTAQLDNQFSGQLFFDNVEIVPLAR
jgi:hypothetical protein